MINTAAIDGARRLDRGRRASGRTAASGDFARHLDTGAAQGAPDVGGLAGVAGLDALIGIQEVGDDGSERRRSTRRYGDDLLDRLETLRRQLLAGTISGDDLVALAQTLRRQQHRSGDDALDTVIADIELRVEIEIAKLQISR